MFVIRGRGNRAFWKAHAQGEWTRDIRETWHYASLREALEFVSRGELLGYDFEIVEFVEPEPQPRWVEKRVVA